MPRTKPDVLPCESARGLRFAFGLRAAPREIHRLLPRGTPALPRRFMPSVHTHRARLRLGNALDPGVVGKPWPYTYQQEPEGSDPSPPTFLLVA
jgi:hypothetical protein